MDKMSEEFEAWMIKTGNIAIRKNEAGDCYYYSGTELAWQAWKESRSMLNAELDVIDARIKHECEKADYLKVVCAKIIDDINSIQIERF